MFTRIRNAFVNEIGFLPFLFSTIYTAKAIGIAFWPVDMVSYIALALFSVIILSNKVKFDGWSLGFVIYLPISILIDQPSGIFSPWIRFALLLLLMLCVSPLVASDYAMKFRSGVMKMTLVYCVLISAISFFCYFLGINLMKNSLSYIEMGYLINKSGTFSGITCHSMLLGPISGIAAIACTYLAIRDKHRITFLSLSLLCFGALLFSASRSALIATISGEICLLWFHTKKRSITLKYMTMIVLAAAVTYPLWESALDGINAKNQGNINTGLNTSSREDKWEIRLAEFSDSPITGIGFASVSNRDYYMLDGTIEPGSSWLAVLSMTGIVGLTFFSIIFYRAIRNSLFTKTSLGALLGAILVLLGVHMIAEGHIFSAGSFLCYCVWLSIGCCTNYRATALQKSRKICLIPK